jgi:hypothetical protein
VQGRPGLAEWCARACDASSGCSAVSLHTGRRTCTLHGPTSARAELVDGAADRSAWDTVRKARVQVGVPKWECLSGSGPKWERAKRDTVRKRVRAGGCALVCDACASLLLRRSLRPTARKALSAWSSLKQRCDHPDPSRTRRTIRSHGDLQRKRGAAQHGTPKECHEPMKTTVEECMQGRGGGRPFGGPGRAGHVACGMWHVACGMWHVACGMWHVACGMWRSVSQSVSQRPSTSVASSAVHTLTVGFISSCHFLAISILFCGFAACDRTGDTREHQRCVQPFPVSTPSTPL